MMHRDAKGSIATVTTDAILATSNENSDNMDSDSSFYSRCNTYLTYRPLSNLPTPPPTYKENKSPSLATSGNTDHGEPASAKYRGPAIHLVNLIPSSASLTPASVPDVQALLSRVGLPIETIALAVCILDSLDKKFARAWRLSCPLHPDAPVPLPSSSNKRRSLPSTPLVYQHQQHQMLHIDSVRPELIILAALVIATKYTEDPQRHMQYYCDVWGKGMWSNHQLNVTERCIMESLNYRIMPLCDEDCLADAMVDMQLAGRELDWDTRELTPPDSVASADNDNNMNNNLNNNNISNSNSSSNTFVLDHSQAKTIEPPSEVASHGRSLMMSGSLYTATSESATPRSGMPGPSYF